MSQDHNHMNHATWECKYHVVFTPKYRKKVLFGQIRRHLGTVFHELARRKECQIEEGHLMPDHVHMLIAIPPKYSVAEVIGYLKGKSSIWIVQNVERKLAPIDRKSVSATTLNGRRSSEDTSGPFRSAATHHVQQSTSCPRLRRAHRLGAL